MNVNDLTSAYIISKMSVDCLKKIIDNGWGVERVAYEIESVIKYRALYTEVLLEPDDSILTRMIKRPTITYVVDKENCHQIIDVQYNY